MKKLSLLLLLFIADFSVAYSQITYKPNDAGILYVDSASTVDPSQYNWIGDSWDKAIPQLADALQAADSLNRGRSGTVKQIWVAKGTYKPKYSAEDGHRKEDDGWNNAFVLIKDVKIVGGFAGTESSVDARDTAKFFSDNKTILNGNNRSYHVVIASGDMGAAVLDGFVIYKGDAQGSRSKGVRVNNSVIYKGYGGGLYNYNSSPDIINCIFSRNYAENGGGIYNYNSSPKISKSQFSGNFSLATGGGAVYDEDASEPHFSHCIFSNNVAYHYGPALGGGVYNSNSFPSFSNCRFVHNKATKGGAIFNANQSEPVMTNCILAGNTADEGGGAVYEGSTGAPMYLSCLFSGNKATEGGAFYLSKDADISIYNCTIAGNLATDPTASGSIQLDHATPVIRNSILWGNSSLVYYHGYGPNIVQYSLVQSDDFAGTSGHNISEDPLFVHPVSYSQAPTTKGDYRLKPNSPALNKGIDKISDYIQLPDTDLAGNARILGSKPDMGAYEIQSYAPDQNGVFYVNKNVSGGNGRGTSWDNAVKELSDALLIAGQINKVHPGTVRQIWVAHGRYYPLYSAEDGHRTENDGSNNAFVLLKNVKLFGGFVGTETSLSQRGDTTQLFSDAQKTVLTGQVENYGSSSIYIFFTRHVAVASGITDAALDGFVITKGNAESIKEGSTIQVNGISVPHDDGGGIDIENSTITIQECKFTDNKSTTLGGAVNSFESDVIIDQCQFVGNSSFKKGGAIASHQDGTSQKYVIENSAFSQNYIVAQVDHSDQYGGGAVYVNGGTNINIKECDFKSNSTPDSYYENGGAIYVHESSPVISNCSFDKNISAFGGAIYNHYSSPTIIRCTFNNNKASYEDEDSDVGYSGQGGALYNSYSSPNIINCSLFDNIADKDGGAIANRHDNTSVLISGCLFAGNHVNVLDPVLGGKYGAGYGGEDLYSDENAKIAVVNCTFITRDRNRGDIDWEIFNANTKSASSKIINSIIWGWSHAGVQATDITYSIVQQPSGQVYDGDGNLNKDPLFVDFSNENYHLQVNSPAIAAGQQSTVQQYHLPDEDLDHNPRVVDGKINMGAYGSTFVHPSDLVTTYDGRDTVNISWEAPLKGDESYVSGDKFKLERSTDSTFQNNIKTITSTIKYAPDKKSYAIADDITDISGGLTLYYRLTRTMAQNQDWQRPTYDTTHLSIITQLKGIKVDTLIKPDGSIVGEITWKPFTGVWPQGTQFNLIKKNKTDGTQQSISIEEDSARAGHYIDDNIPSCKEIRYTLSVKLGNHYSSPADADIPDSILTKKLAVISNLSASKGYYPDRTTLHWTAAGSYDHYAINRKVYGSSDAYQQIATIDGQGLHKLNADDDKGTPGVYYQYAVTGLTQCSGVTLYSDTIYAVGFRSPTGTVYGRITYDKGGGAVQDATVRMESRGNTKLGKSIHLDGRRGSSLKVDSLSTPLPDSAFTISIWIKPDEKAPKGQVLFSNEGKYSLGFNKKGQLYFGYLDDRVTEPYTPDTLDGWLHLAGIHRKGSLTLMVNTNDTCMTARTVIPYEPAQFIDQTAYLGGNSDGFSFKGYMDEVRLWNVARDSATIAGDYSRLLTGGEPGLVAYWRFDASVKDQFYDLSHSGSSYHRNDGVMDSLHVRHSNNIPSTDKLSLKAYTDSTGNYTITGIPYTGVEGTPYAIAPLLGTHSFDPISVTRIFSSGSSTFTLDFKDKSSYTVSGTVTYNNTGVPVQGVQFKIDGNYAYNGNGGIAQTNSKGAFSLSVPVGVHSVQAVKANHVFVNDGKILTNGKDVNYQQNMAGITLFDSTTIRFIGRIAGGPIETNVPLGFSLSKNILGDSMAITLKSKGNYILNSTDKTYKKTYKHLIRSNQQKGEVGLPDSAKTEVIYKENKIIIHPDVTTGEFEANLIPADFLIDQDKGVVVNGYKKSPLSSSIDLNLKDSLIERTIIDSLNSDSIYHIKRQQWSYTTSYDTVKYNASYIFTYNVEPVVTVGQSMSPGNPNTFDYFGNASYDFTNVLGKKIEIPTYDKSTQTYTFGKPVFEQGNSYTLKIRSFQDFPYYDAQGTRIDHTEVPSFGGKVIIHNEIKAGSATPDAIKLDSAGIAYYSFRAGAPELVSPYLKGFSVSVQIGNEVYQWENGEKKEAFVFGGVSDGTDFVTSGPDMRVGVLRDPPGSNSFAYLEQGATFTHSLETSSSFNFTNAVGGEASLLPTVTTEVGVGMQVGLSVEPILKGSASWIMEKHHETTNATTTSVTFTKEFQTSDDPSFDGAPDDIFIGYATNITFGNSRILLAVPTSTVQNTDIPVLPGKQYSIVEREGFHSGQQFKTMFIYPQYYILHSLIPNLVKIRNKILAEGTSYSNPQATADAIGKEVYFSLRDTSDPKYGSYNMDSTVWGTSAASASNYNLGPSYHIFFPHKVDGTSSIPERDTIMIIDQEINNWKDWLKENEKNKVTADYTDNYSFGAGSSLDITKQVDKVETQKIHYQYIVGSKWAASLGYLVNNAGLVATEEGTKTHTPTDTTGTTLSDTTTTIGFHLEENGSNYLSVSVGKDDNDFPVYQTKGGVTSCPYEDSSTTKYYQPGTLLNQKTLQREEPRIRVTSNNTVSGIASNRAASYTLQLYNESSVKGDIYFGLNVIDKSNPYGAKIYLDGTPLGNGRTILIPSGERLTKTLTVEKGPDSMNYDHLQIVLHSTCQYNPVVYSYNIADTASVSAHFLPGCSDIHISSPKDKWILNTLSPEITKGTDTLPYLPITLDKYDLNKKRFNHIALQYKSANSSTWITTMRFFTDSANYKNDKQGGPKQVIQSPHEIDYDFPMDNTFADGQYDIRALSVCMDNGTVIAQTPSNTVSGIKDTYRPRPFGHPQPADGILGIGQNASIRFNEPIDIGFLNQQIKSRFFTVQGIKNGSSTDSTVSIQLDGQKDFAATEFDKNMTGKDFTVAMWFMPEEEKGGTLFSQGNKNNAVELTLTDDYHLQASIGSQTFTSGSPLPYFPRQWVHIALVYQPADSSIEAFYNSKKILIGKVTTVYKGIGPFIFGKSLQKDGHFFTGKIRDVRIWTEALTSIKLQKNKMKSMSGGENHLLACYPMDEGRGRSLHDKAHGNNARFTGEWETPEGRSVAFDGDGYVRLNTSQAVITPEMDFTLSLWFKAVPGQKNATLISSGKGEGNDPGGSRHLFSLGFEKGKLTFNNNGYKVQVNSNYLDNNWHQVVIAANRNTGTAQFYVDGLLKKFFDANNLGGLAATYTYLGARAYHQDPDSTITHFDQYFKGNIDEVRIWNTYLNSTLISKESNKRLTGKEVGLLAWYPFETHTKSSSGVWSTHFTLADMKIQQDTANHIPAAITNHADESRKKAPMTDPGPQQNLNYNFVANNDAVVFNFSGGTGEMKAIDKTIVTFTAKEIRDLHGNIMASPVTWTAYIDQNPLDWSDENLNLSKDLNKSLQFDSYIFNSGGKAENYHLDNLPPWLEADPISGTVPPEGKQKITFTVNKGLNVGTYDEMVYMQNDNDETQVLSINLQVIGQTPDWEVNPSDFRYNMTVYGKIRIEGIFSSDPEDMLAAFRNGKCVGMVHNAYFKTNDLWYSFLTIYSNDKNFDAKELTFRIWDASTGKVYTGIPSQSFSFKNGAIRGTPSQPVIFDGVNLIFQNIPLQKGWNWLSFNVKNPTSEAINTVLENGQWSGSDVIKMNNQGFASYSAMTQQWVSGKLKVFDNRFSYMLKTGREQKLSTEGSPIDVTTTAIPINGNAWNYISYLPRKNMTLKEALADYKATDEDVIKSQTGFAMYDSQLGWVGNLNYMEPGKGYMLYSNASGKDSFYYPQLQGVLRLQDQRWGAVRRYYPNLDLSRLNYMELPVENNFKVPENMTVIAAVGTGVSVKRGDKIAAFQGNRLAGKALGIPNPITHHAGYFFNLSGQAGQKVSFELLRDGKKIAETSPIFLWSANKMIGSLKTPLKLHFEKNYFSVKLYPNPFKKVLTIQIKADNQKIHHLNIKIYDVSGQLIFAKENLSVSSGFYETGWKGQTFNGTVCRSGVYFLHLTLDKISHVYKIVKQ